MSRDHKPSDVWLKASIVGANWAASEIILGSFLHNLNVPFKGSILTAIGLILMISVAQVWKDKGLFWRSGLICALMKTMSPSAVIFGPMIAIFMESLLLEFSVRISGRNTVGFIFGSILAMSWVFVQKIVNFIIYYGFSIVDIYSNLLKYAEKQLNIHFNTYWLPLLVLLGIYVLFGVFAAIVGIKISRSLDKREEKQFTKADNKENISNKKSNDDFKYSIIWLISSFIGIIGTIFLISKSNIYVWMPIAIIIVTLWIIRYKRGMRQLFRPGFWIFFILTTALSAILISKLDGGNNSLMVGLITGLKMNFRAAVIIVGFAVLGTELYNPRIRDRMMKSAFRHLPVALELGFESLPYVIANLPDAKTFIKKPSYVVKTLISHSEKRFSEIKEKYQSKVFIISGKVSEGKTNKVIEIVRKLKERGIRIGGFYSPRIIENGETIGYDLVSAENDSKVEFLRIKRNNNTEGIGRFEINNMAIVWGRQILSNENIKDKRVIIIDEAGRFEINGGGWSERIQYLLNKGDILVILTVRDIYKEEVVNKFEIKNYHSTIIKEVNIEDIIGFVDETQAFAR